jgi:hypothetical protein
MENYKLRFIKMPRKPQKKSSSPGSTELGDLFGPPPVLSSENIKAYVEMLTQLMECFGPIDFMEQMLIRQYADCTWEMLRYSRHRTLAIERKFRQHLEFQAKRANALAQKVGQTPGLPAQRPSNKFARMFELEEIVENVVVDVDKLLARSPDEIDHARALEAAIAYYARLDDLLSATIARRNDVLEQFERYRHGTSRRPRVTSDRTIEGETTPAQIADRPRSRVAYLSRR